MKKTDIALLTNRSNFNGIISEWQRLSAKGFHYISGNDHENDRVNEKNENGCDHVLAATLVE